MGHALVTGGAGFIGAHVTDALLARGHTVTVLDDLSGGFRNNVPRGPVFLRGSINNTPLVNRLFQDTHFDYVFHLAAYAAEGLSHFIKGFNYRNNLIGSVNLINAAVNTGVTRFVFTSSIAVYGASAELPLTEESRPQPEDPYGIAKLAVELELAISRSMFGLDYVIFRPHNVYGEKQNIGDRYRNVVGIFMNQILQGVPMSVFGDGEQTRAFTYVGDVAPIIAESAELPEAANQVFNVGADRFCTVNALAEEVARAMGVTPDVRHVPARKEVAHAYCAHDKLRRVFGVRPLTPLEDGVARMAAWVRQHAARQSRPFERIEVTKNFPHAWLPPPRGSGIE